MSQNYITDLAAALWAQLPDTATDWLKSAMAELSSTYADPERASELHLRYSAMARRKLGTELLAGLSNEAQWQTSEVGRLMLLAQLLEMSAGQNTRDLVRAAYKFGDEYEQVAIIKGLDLIDSEGQLTDLALATGRTNSLNLYAAIALNNPYPAHHYYERAFHQLVLKALFMDMDISQIMGLQERQSAELSMLAMDLVNERLAADRSPPKSIWLTIDYQHLDAANQAIYRKFIANPLPEHRYFSLLGLLQHETFDFDADFWSALKQQGSTETVDAIQVLTANLIHQGELFTANNNRGRAQS